MASNRHLGRIIALQTLYESEYRIECEDQNYSLSKVLKRNIKRYESTVEDSEFIHSLVNGVSDKLQELDDLLQPIAPDWPIQQIARIDRAILRIGTYELLYSENVPAKVVINEAVELAKSFGGENSSKFINGVLGTVLRNKNGEGSDQETSKKPTKKSTNKKKKT